VSTPVLVDGTLYFGSFDLYFYAVNAASGTLKWRSAEPAEKWFWASPVIHNGKVYAPNLDGKIYTYNAGSGIEALAPINLEGAIVSTPALYKDWLFVGTEGGEIFRVDTANGQSMRYFSESADDEDAKFHAPLVENQGVVYVHTQTPDKIYTFDAETGQSEARPLGLTSKD
jgi:outer membrane protein assembly factor BamB